MRKVLLGLLGVMLSLSAGEVYATFNVEADKDAKLAFDASGIVQSVKYDEASFVKKGAVLASLESADIKATLDMAKTALKYAKADYERQLKVRSLIDEGKFDQYAFKYEDAKNQVAYAQAKYDKTFLKAPFDGVIYEKNIEIGDTVSGMMLTTVFKVQSKSERKLIVEFDQKYHTEVKAGQKFKYTVDGDTESYEGIITKIYPSASTQNRKIKAEVNAKNLVVGLFGSGSIITETK
ncbi:MAG: efflux RND transporter periplasmic adaptor subunit [Sulfurimonas sp.]|nr:efflux RND transporter periplasmic adaptor subunit [Sulfurimonas sp.]